MSDVSNLIMKDDAIFNDLARKLPNGVYLNISETGVSAINISTPKVGTYANPNTVETLASKTFLNMQWSRMSLS
jgi:hypothetical protein